MNKVEISGLIQEPLRVFQTKRGTSGASCRILNVEQNEFGETTANIGITAFGQAAEKLIAAKVGGNVKVIGKIVDKTWEKPEGKTSRWVEISAASVEHIAKTDVVQEALGNTDLAGEEAFIPF